MERARWSKVTVADAQRMCNGGDIEYESYVMLICESL